MGSRKSWKQPLPVDDENDNDNNDYNDNDDNDKVNDDNNNNNNNKNDNNDTNDKRNGPRTYPWGTPDDLYKNVEFFGHSAACWH